MVSAIKTKNTHGERDLVNAIGFAEENNLRVVVSKLDTHHGVLFYWRFESAPVDIEDVEHATRAVRQAAPGSADHEAVVADATRLIRQADRQLESSALAEPEARILQIVRDELAEAVDAHRRVGSL